MKNHVLHHITEGAIKELLTDPTKQDILYALHIEADNHGYQMEIDKEEIVRWLSHSNDTTLSECLPIHISNHNDIFQFCSEMNVYLKPLGISLIPYDSELIYLKYNK